MRSLAAVLFLLAACSDNDAPATAADAGTIKPDASSTPEASTPTPPDTGAPAPTVLTSGDGYSMVYSATGGIIGVDGRPDVSATFDAAGGLKGYFASDDENLSRGVASVAGAGGDTLAAWGAWREGPTSGKWYAAKPSGDFTFAAGGDFHYAIGKKSISAAWPATTKSYALAGGSVPTIDGLADAATLATATASCDLGTARTCTIRVTASASGGTLTLEETNASINTGPAGAGRVQVGGFIAMFAGPAAEQMLLVYDGKLTGGTNDGKTLRGSAVLK